MYYDFKRLLTNPEHLEFYISQLVISLTVKIQFLDPEVVRKDTIAPISHWYRILFRTYFEVFDIEFNDLKVSRYRVYLDFLGCTVYIP